MTENIDRKTLEDHIDKVSKIVEDNPDVWKSKSAFFQWLKGVIRKGWNKHPVKLKLLKDTTKDIPNINPKSVARFPTVKGNVCSVCGGLFPRNQCEVDHVIEEPARLSCLEDVQGCVEKLLVVCKDDLRVVCKECHGIISHQQRTGMSFEEAKIDKQVVALMKDKKERERLLKEHGYKDIAVSNDSKRRKALTDILKKESRGV